jgi:DNA-binding NarL/FixJ family response regulator
VTSIPVTVVAAADAAARARWNQELRVAPDVELVGELDEASAIEARVVEVVPDVLLMSTDLAGLDVVGLDIVGLDIVGLCDRLTRAVPASRVVLVSGQHDAPYAAVAAGAAGAVAADQLEGRVADIVRRTARGEALLPPQWAQLVLEGPAAARLTATEREVLQRVAKGATSEAVAALYEVPPRLVHLHAGYALAKVYRAASED